MIETLNANQEVSNQIMKARHVYLEIQYIDEIRKINEMYPHLVSRLNYLFYCYTSKSIIKSIETDLIDELSLIEPNVKNISIDHTLSPYELKLVSVLLCSRRTRFSLWDISINFKFLSECLSILSLCADCIELESIWFEYSEVDLDNENELVKSSVQDFRKKSGFITELIINHMKD